MFAFLVFSHNHVKSTIRTLESLLNFTDENIYLIHSGSDWKNIRELKSTYPEVHHIILEADKGFTTGMNSGLKKVFALNEWCFFLNNDCELLRVGSLPTDPAFIAPRILQRKSLKVDSLGGTFDPSLGLAKPCSNLEEFYSATKMRYIPSTSFLLHREIFEITQGFDESLFASWEDVDFSQRVVALDYPMLIDQDWVVRTGIGKTSPQESLYSIYYFERNRKKISYKYSHNLMEKSKLLAHLSQDWMKLSVKLIRSGRSSELKHLSRALMD